MPKIKKITAREVLDSRGNPTVEADVLTEKFVASSIVPSGASTGKHEALELRDNDKKRYDRKGVLKAVDNINKIISKKLVGLDCRNQKQIDELMISLDGTENKSKLGANAMLAVSMAVCKAGALHNNADLFEYIRRISGSKEISLPIPQLNIINGGKHAGMENDIQEHMIMPFNFKNFKDALRAGVEVYHELKSLLKQRYGAQGTLLADEGGFAPKANNIHDRLDLISNAIRNAGYEKKIKLALDCAASEFYYDGYYKVGNEKYNFRQLIDFYRKLVEKYEIISIEDGMAEDDWQGWQQLTKELGSRIQLVGDDLLVTNTDRIKKAIKESSCNSLLLKVNQIGTVTEAIEAANLAFKNRWKVVVSHRSGETEDSFIADLVVGLNAGQSKFGAPARSERTAKYNRLLRIEEILENQRFSVPRKSKGFSRVLGKKAKLAKF
ncbi:phosphopyruvate hydratase [Candidatus Woesearchaeota archaeon]|nr:phosphopyruvate hydratase [Candidatus Woesearchaeota archaeon]